MYLINTVMGSANLIILCRHGNYTTYYKTQCHEFKILSLKFSNSRFFIGIIGNRNDAFCTYMIIILENSYNIS